jgi:hypothetical protein
VCVPPRGLWHCLGRVQPACGLRRSRRMIRRSWVILAVPAAAITRAPAMAARNSATASDRRRCAPRKLMLTACAFWMMKIITTMSPRTPAIRLVRKPLIRVCARRCGGACRADEGGGVEPLGEGGGSVVVVSGGAGVSVMKLLLSGVGAAVDALAGSLAHPGLPRLPAAASRCLFSDYTGKLNLAIAF